MKLLSRKKRKNNLYSIEVLQENKHDRSTKTKSEEKFFNEKETLRTLKILLKTVIPKTIP